MRLIFVVGRPRAGKTTYAKLLSEKTGWPIIDDDAVREAIYGTRDFDKHARELNVWHHIRRVPGVP
jgi:adenylate kinase family enzyme